MSVVRKKKEATNGLLSEIVILNCKALNTMDKSNYFSGKSVFGQLISLTEYKTIKEEVKMCDSDKAFKNFTDHRIGFVTRIIMQIIKKLRH